MSTLEILLVVWPFAALLVGIALGRFFKAAEGPDHARIKNASGGSADGDDVLAHVAPRNTTNPEQ